MAFLNLVDIHNRLVTNDANVIQEIYKNKPVFQQMALDILDDYKTGKYNGQLCQNYLDPFMKICNILYNNFDTTVLIDDGIYDMLMIVYKQLFPNSYQVGAEPVNLDFTGAIEPEEDLDGYRYPFRTIDFDKGETLDNWLFADDLLVQPPVNPAYYEVNVDRSVYPKNEKNTLIVPHKYPKLVGTLDKCKFTLMSEAVQAGVVDDPTIKIFERDFLGKHLQMGILDPNHIELLLELKMDGMSVEADVTNKILSARSRGDTGLDLADDLTTVFKDYEFPNCPPMDESFGMKFEAIITKTNLERLSALRGRPYKNARNGLIGLVKSIDAYAFRDLITLVPLETSLDIDPVTEIKFMNQYYTKDVYLPYAVVSGDYNTVLYQVYRFVREAEKSRSITNFLYDGIVVHYIDPRIRQILGRENSVNKYSMAIKFNPLKKQTIFRGYTFTIGQNGVITPMAHYDPVEFLGTIHTKSSCHSYGRFRELQLAVGDVVDVTYVNDVMPYLTKPYSEFSGEFESHNPPIPFPERCPCCGSPIAIADGGAGDTAICTNFYCPDRNVARIVNMMDKLSIKGFAEASIRKLGLKSFKDMITIDQDSVIEALGPGNGANFITARNQFLSTPIQDYRLIGALGFTNTAVGTWKKILAEVPIDVLLMKKGLELVDILTNVKGIGKVTAETIVSEMPLYVQDIDMIRRLPNIQFSYGMKQKIIRWTGCRDQALEEKLTNMGYDANSKAGVTKNTDLLIVPYTGYSSTKMNKIGPDTKIVAIDEFIRNMDYYLTMIK